LFSFICFAATLETMKLNTEMVKTCRSRNCPAANCLMSTGRNRDKASHKNNWSLVIVLLKGALV
jgi:hypothetical protein